jgi:putative membrane protein
MGHGLGLGIPGLGMLIFWGALILLLIWLFKGISTNGSKRTDNSPRDILERRYARGEIGRDEYLEKKKSLEW